MDAVVVELGRGEWISNYGTYEGSPAVFLEPVKSLGFEQGVAGQSAPASPKDALAHGSVILRIHDSAGAHVVMEDLVSAMNFVLGANRNIPKSIK